MRVPQPHLHCESEDANDTHVHKAVEENSTPQREIEYKHPHCLQNRIVTDSNLQQVMKLMMTARCISHHATAPASMFASFLSNIRRDNGGSSDHSHVNTLINNIGQLLQEENGRIHVRCPKCMWHASPFVQYGIGRTSC